MPSCLVPICELMLRQIFRPISDSNTQSVETQYRHSDMSYDAYKQKLRPAVEAFIFIKRKKQLPLCKNVRVSTTYNQSEYLYTNLFSYFCKTTNETHYIFMRYIYTAQRLTDVII